MMTAVPPDTIGLVVRRAPRQLAAEPFYGELSGGLEQALGDRGLQVLMQVVDGMPAELESYRRWARSGSVRGVVLVDVVPDDPRPALLMELGLPAVIVGEPAPGVGLPSVRTDAYASMRDAVTQLAALGHRSIARVTGLTSLVHTRERTRAFVDTAAALGITGRIEQGDYSAESGRTATRRLLSAADAPTAVVYDNDVMAVAGLETARGLGVSVPDRLSILAWDDSQLCRLAVPALSVMSHDVHAQGMLAGRSLLEMIDGNHPGDVLTPDPVFVPRASTAAVIPLPER